MTTTLMTIFAKILPFTLAFAATGSSFMDTLIEWAAGIGGGIIALFLIVSLVKDGIEFAKGQGSVSIFKIIGKALFLILIIGLVFLAVNYIELGTTASNIGNGVIDIVETEANNIVQPQK